MRILGIVVLGLTACAKDLRPKSLKAFGDTVPAGVEAQGRAVLAAAAEAHGLDAWQRTTQIELDVVDTWRVGLVRSMMTPLPDRVTELTYRFDVNSGFVGEGVLTGGKHQGDRFGVAGKPGPDSYIVSKGKRKQKGGLEAKIYAPSVQYFTEFPFRILDAEHVAYVDRVAWKGRPHDRVLATWGGMKPHISDDQYLLYVDAESHTISAARYTIRVAGRPMASAIVFDDLREVDGMRLPFFQQVGFFREDGVREFHRLEVQAIRTGQPST
ncbi:MAG: hypothetical protein AAGA48_30470 [Myxococcota bacterium]